MITISSFAFATLLDLQLEFYCLCSASWQINSDGTLASIWSAYQTLSDRSLFVGKLAVKNGFGVLQSLQVSQILFR